MIRSQNAERTNKTRKRTTQICEGARARCVEACSCRKTKCSQDRSFFGPRGRQRSICWCSLSIATARKRPSTNEKKLRAPQVKTGPSEGERKESKQFPTGPLEAPSTGINLVGGVNPPPSPISTTGTENGRKNATSLGVMRAVPPKCLESGRNESVGACIESVFV
jgi:hypothetical protein